MSDLRLTQLIFVSQSYLEAGLALIALTLLGARHAWGRYRSLTAFFGFLLWGNTARLLIPHLHKFVERHLLYKIYFDCYWSSWIVEAILMIVFCYGILTRLFWSVPNLRFIAIRVFWAIVLLWGVMSASQLFAPYLSGMRLVVADAEQLQQLAGEVALFTAVTVFAGIRPLGIELRSPLPAFGLGLGFSAMILFSDQLMTSTRGAGGFQRFMIFDGAVVCAQLLCWIAAISWLEDGREIVSAYVSDRLW